MKHSLPSCNSLWADTSQILCWQANKRQISQVWLDMFLCALMWWFPLMVVFYERAGVCFCACAPLHVCLDVFISSPHRMSAEEGCSKYFCSGNGSWLTNFVMELRIWDAYIKTSRFMDESTYINVFFLGYVLITFSHSDAEIAVLQSFNYRLF